MGAVQSEYAWRSAFDENLRVIEPTRNVDQIRGREWKYQIRKFLKSERPDVCAVAGYSHPSMLALILECIRSNLPWILMSDSQEIDAKRQWILERVKARIVRLASSALVAGRRHREYLIKLGFAAENINVGYDVVDNSHFSSGVDQYHNLVGFRRFRYFLCCSRFIPKKNLLNLIAAYADSCAELKNRDSSSCRIRRLLPLVIVGEGEMRQEILAQAERFNIVVITGPGRDELNQEQTQPILVLPGFVQADSIAEYYAGAAAFILPSTTDQWGLVVNEAMASRLPVIVSERCGCVPELIEEGVNGWAFAPSRVGELAALMTRVAAMDSCELEAMGQRGSEIIRHWDLDRFCKGLERSAEIALQREGIPASLLDKMLIGMLALR